MNRLSGKNAIVTGAAQGIGRAILIAFAKAGANVLAVDLSEERLEDSLKEAASYDVKAIDMGCDLANIHSLDAVIHRAETDLGEVDILVNCAGVCPTRAMMDIDEETWRAVFDVNVHAPFFLTQAASKRMIPRGYGVILNMASISGMLPKLEQIDYGASKAALISITRSTALCLGPLGIRVNAIAPGVIETPLTQSIAQQRAELRGVSPKETLEPVLSATPLRRIGSADEVANLAVFLASDEASYITGQTYVVDGGFLMR
ncbi:MAG: SDR family oxidoreductase [Fimbriimonadaceae bacterium]|nr:SDR family oxidoreductase [Fimbriimonadaceae bacterium]